MLVRPVDYLSKTEEAMEDAIEYRRTVQDRRIPYLEEDYIIEGIQMTIMSLLKVGLENKLMPKESLIKTVVENAREFFRAQLRYNNHMKAYRETQPWYSELGDLVPEKDDPRKEYPVHVWQTVLAKTRTYGEGLYLINNMPLEYLPTLDYIEEPTLRRAIDGRLNVEDEDMNDKIIVSEWPTRFLDTLTPLQQRVVHLRKMGRTYDQINESLRINGNAAAVILQRVKKKFEKWSKENS